MKLQDAIDYFNTTDPPPEVVYSPEMLVVLEAVRKYANPPPRLELIEAFVTELLRGDLINQNSSNIEGEVRQLVLNLTSRWDAALADTEAPDGQ